MRAKTTGELIIPYSEIGHRLDAAGDDDMRRFLLRARRAVGTAVEDAWEPNAHLTTTLAISRTVWPCTTKTDP